MHTTIPRAETLSPWWKHTVILILIDGSYLGPDFSAAYLHYLVEDTRDYLARSTPADVLSGSIASGTVTEGTALLLKQNRYDAAAQTLEYSTESQFFRTTTRRLAGLFCPPGPQRFAQRIHH